MKIFTLFALIVSSACNMPTLPKSDPPIVIRTTIDSIMSEYDIQYSKLPNDLQRKDFKQKFLAKIKKVLSDSLHFHLGNIPVTITKISNDRIASVKAFYATFEDKAKNEYWTEFDYKESDTVTLYKNPVYNLIKDLPNYTDTVFSFFYMGNIEWQPVYENKVRIQVVPFPKNFNFDSSKNANSASKKYKKQ